VVTFPGSLDDRDAQRAVRLAGRQPVALWHADADLQGVDAVVLPAASPTATTCAPARSPASPRHDERRRAGRPGLPVLGICNGFQVLCESGLLPGALTRNAHLHFVNRDQRLRIESTDSAGRAASRRARSSSCR
jgi:phosphoribosylformylglycinamidine synthase